jgi:hypothetical protein
MSKCVSGVYLVLRMRIGLSQALGRPTIEFQTARVEFSNIALVVFAAIGHDWGVHSLNSLFYARAFVHFGWQRVPARHCEADVRLARKATEKTSGERKRLKPNSMYV